MIKGKAIVSLGTDCVPRTPEPIVGSTVTIKTVTSNPGTVPIPARWRLRLIVDPTDHIGMATTIDGDVIYSPITVGGQTPYDFINFPITEDMSGKSYDVEIIVYNEDRSVEYGRGKCIGLMNVQGVPPQYGASLTNIRADPAEYDGGDNANIKFNIANTGTVRTTYFTYIRIWSGGYEANYGPFRDSIDPGGNASLGKLIQLEGTAPFGWYNVTVTVQYPDGTTLDDGSKSNAFEIKEPVTQYIWGYVTDILGIPLSAIRVEAEHSGAYTMTDGGGYYNLDPWASLTNSPITASDPLGRYASQTQYVDYTGAPVKLPDFRLSALTMEVQISNFHVNGY